jgi:Rhodanese-like domain
MAVLIVGGLLVAALVVWALTRTVEPESVMSTPTADATSTYTPPAGAVAPTTTMPTTTSPVAVTGTNNIAVPPPTAAPQPQGDRNAVKRIAAEDLRAQINRGEVTVIDVRTAADYARGHISGAINIPFASVETQLDSIPKDKPIVTYCT